MPLANTRDAIGAVTQLLYDRLQHILANPPLNAIDGISVGRPDAPPGTVGNPRLNLFLYQLEFDGNLRNVPLDAGRPTPLWLVLHYLLTAFDKENESDSIDAQRVLGTAIRSLDELNFSGLFADDVAALADNPDRLKISFDHADPELIARLTQGDNGHFRLSASFQVRPVMIAGRSPGDAALLVGMDYEANAIIGETGIQLPVLPSLGARIEGLSPDAFEVKDEVEIGGSDLHTAGLGVTLGGQPLAVIGQRPDWLRVRIPDDFALGTRISAGSHALAVVQRLPSGRQRSSNLLVATLRPQLSTAVPFGMQRVDATDPGSPVYGDIDLEGILMGRAMDDVDVALYRPITTPDESATLRRFDRFVEVPNPPAPSPPPHTPQTRMRLQIPMDDPLPQGRYRLVLRVNGQQARRSPEVDLRLP